MTEQIWLWIGFNVLVLAMLALDLGLFHRKARLRRLGETGDLKAKAALALAESPNRFLATVQVGMTRFDSGSTGTQVWTDRKRFLQVKAGQACRASSR
jgi:CBS domain containing-hemolysin-like protein